MLTLAQIGAQHAHHLIEIILTLRGTHVGSAQMIAQMPFEHFRHQAVDGATNGGNLLQHRHAVVIVLQPLHQGLHLALNAAGAGE